MKEFYPVYENPENVSEANLWGGPYDNCFKSEAPGQPPSTPPPHQEDSSKKICNNNHTFLKPLIKV